MEPGSGAELDRYLDSVLIGGREPFTPVICDPDPAWASRFAELAAGITAALGDTALAVEHIGSTSVPGLPAKPIVDVLVVVADVDNESYVAPMQDAGFVLRVRERGHRMFRTPEKDAHVHVLSDGDQAISDYRDLRDWLRVDASDRVLYADLKRDLATRSWSDMNHYAEAKTGVITQVLGRARAWRASSARRGRAGGGDVRVGGADADLDARLSAELDGRTKGLPVAGTADVHFRKDLEG